MFKGFNIKYPEYEVHTPQTNLTYNLRSLNVQEEEKLKGSLLSAMKINEHLNIRVLLDEASSKKSQPFSIKSDKGFNIHRTFKKKAKIITKVKELNIRSINNHLYISLNRKTYRRIKTREIDIKPISHVFRLNKRPYKGELKFKITNNEKLLIINKLDLEKYKKLIRTYFDDITIVRLRPSERISDSTTAKSLRFSITRLSTDSP